MIGFYDYTVVLTYISLMCSVFGITQAIGGHYRTAIICLALSGLFDMFDGKIARKYNIKAAVKLQYRNLDTFIHPDYKGRKDVNHIPRFESTRLTYDQFTELVEAIRSEGMIAMSTPFDEDGVDWCMDQGLDIIKVASCSSLDWPLLEKIAATHKPVIISVGGKTISDIDKLLCIYALHCRISGTD